MENSNLKEAPRPSFILEMGIGKIYIYLFIYLQALQTIQLYTCRPMIMVAATAPAFTSQVVLTATPVLHSLVALCG
jgi:hypothetical protein